MEKLKYLNVGCGTKYHKAWYNLDMTSNNPDIIKANLLKGIPFSNDFFEVVYHSQVVEHIPKEYAKDFIKECLRVLKPNGILRVVAPDLENIVDEYKKLLLENINNPNEISAANYDWIMLEMYDQTVRNFSGGHMAEYLKNPLIINEEYVLNRIGFVGHDIRNNNSQKKTAYAEFLSAFSSAVKFKKAINLTAKKINQKIKFHSKASKIGSFRLGGEVHMWMYDRFSITRLLYECGFTEISIKDPYKSSIPNWDDYELDVKNGHVYDPNSLFIEARKNKLNHE